MDSKIKALAEAITHTKTKNVVQSHVKSLEFSEDTRHLVITLDNAGPLHELEEGEGDKHLNAGLVKVYGEDITYVLKLPGGSTHEREKAVSRRV